VISSSVVRLRAALKNLPLGGSTTVDASATFSVFYRTPKTVAAARDNDISPITNRLAVFQNFTNFPQFSLYRNVNGFSFDDSTQI
jgi:hypothetical protein